jgi:hypothetical protein
MASMPEKTPDRVRLPSMQPTALSIRYSLHFINGEVYVSYEAAFNRAELTTDTVALQSMPSTGLPL